jgi:hypothetical protein
MLRLACAVAMMLAASPVLAEGWTFDSDRAWATVTNGDARLLVTCAKPGRLGFVYEIASADPAAVDAGEGAELAFSEDERTWDKIQVGLGGGGDRPYFLALIGKVADEWIGATARAQGSVFAAIGAPNSEGSMLHSVTEFSSTGSSAAIRSVRSAC